MERHIEHITDECDKYYSRIITKLSTLMVSIDDFSTQKDNLAEIATSITDITEKISLMSLLPNILPDIKNTNLKKKVEKTIILSSQGSQLISQVEDLCTSSVDKFKK